eukprot:3804565-Pleurochrysis_carterae.AAC.1
MEGFFGKPSFRWISCKALCATLLPPKNKRALWHEGCPRERDATAADWVYFSGSVVRSAASQRT